MNKKPRPQIVQRIEYLKELCREKTVLHLGCTDWPYTKMRLKLGTLLHIELQEIAHELWGFDYDRNGLDLLTQLGLKNLYHVDLERLETVNIKKEFDIVLAAEIIEHLSNPGLFLSGIQRFMGPHSTLVITTINAYCGMRMSIYALRGRGGLAEPVHPDHVAYYSHSTLLHLISRTNLTARRFLFYDVGQEHRPYNRFYLNWINDMCVRIAPQLADGLILECGLGQLAT